VLRIWVLLSSVLRTSGWSKGQVGDTQPHRGRGLERGVIDRIAAVLAVPIRPVVESFQSTLHLGQIRRQLVEKAEVHCGL
jgi:hypothetical protein